MIKVLPTMHSFIAMEKDVRSLVIQVCQQSREDCQNHRYQTFPFSLLRYCLDPWRRLVLRSMRSGQSSSGRREEKQRWSIRSYLPDLFSSHAVCVRRPRVQWNERRTTVGLTLSVPCIFLKFHLVTMQRWNRSFYRKFPRHASDKSVPFAARMVARNWSVPAVHVAVVQLKTVHKSFMSHVHKPMVSSAKMSEKTIANIPSIANNIVRSFR